MATKLLLTLAGVAVFAMPGASALAQDAPEEALDCFKIDVDLPKEEQLACDRLRFGERHFNRVRLTREGVVKSIHLHDGTSREVFTSFPYGIDFAAWDESEREMRMEVEDLADFLKGRPTPGSRRSGLGGEPSDFATGRPIGWNDSTGIAPGDCFNYRIEAPPDPEDQASFTSEHAANSAAEQIKASATVSVAFGKFKVDNDFSFSDQWKSSSNSSNQYYNIHSLFTLNTTVDADTPLNRQGQGATTNFDTLCGREYLSSVQVGMVATVSIAYGSTSSDTQRDIQDKFEGEFGLQSFRAAVDVSNQTSNEESHFLVEVNHYGGGTEASAALHNAFAAGDDKGAYYQQCAQGDTAACTKFNTSMGNGATAALKSFNGLVAGLRDAEHPKNLSFLQIFPEGVANGPVTTMVTSPIPKSDPSDILAPFADKIRTYLELLNEIATLDNRVTGMTDLIDRTTFNPRQVLDLIDYLNELGQIYHADRGTLVSNLTTCLKARSSNVDSACKPIGDNTATSAFEYYEAEPSSCADHCFFAEQNTLALQYTGVYSQFQSAKAPTIGLDGLYIDKLPEFAKPTPKIAGQAALAAFADRPWPAAAFGSGGTGASTDAFISIIALQPGKPISTNLLSPEVAPNPPDLTWWIVHVAGGGIPPLVSFPARITTRTCAPLFTKPCVITIGSQDPQLDFSVSHTPIRRLFK
jgi:hypothetical protein